MILGASNLQVPLIKQAIESGYNTVVVSPNKGEPGFNYSTYSVYVDVCDEEAILYYARKYEIVGIATDQTDIPVRTAAYVADMLGLSSIGYETACLFTDKFLMREKCKELGIPVLKYKKVNNLEDAMDFFRIIDGEAILKPIDNQGSKGVSKITTQQELVNKFSTSLSYSRSGSILIEQYVNGPEFVVDGLVINYDFRNLICGEYNYFDIPDVFSSAYSIFPPQKNKSAINRIEELNRKIITGFGLKNGRTHSEFIMGEKEIYLIETAARGGGVFISSDIVPLLTGINNEELLINIATNKIQDMPPVVNTGIYCCCMAFYLPAGEVITLSGIEEVKALPFTHRNNLDDLYVGLKVNAHSDKTGRTFIIVSGRDNNELVKNIAFIRQTLQIEVMSKDEIKQPIWG